MSTSTQGPAFERFMATADAVAQARPEVDPEMIHEIFAEAATLLHNGLVLDDLDEHDADAVISSLCIDLVAADPGAAIRARSQEAVEQPGGLHDPEAASAAYLTVVNLFQL